MNVSSKAFAHVRYACRRKEVLKCIEPLDSTSPGTGGEGVYIAWLLYLTAGKGVVVTRAYLHNPFSFQGLHQQRCVSRCLRKNSTQVKGADCLYLKRASSAKWELLLGSAAGHPVVTLSRNG